MVSTTYNIGTGTEILNNEVIDSIVKQTGMKTYKIKQVCSIVPTSAWNNTFYREDQTVFTGQTGNAVKGIPQGANFPQRALSFQEVTVRVVKYGLEDNIPWEAILAGKIDIQARTAIRLTEGVVSAVDSSIWDSLTQNLGTDSGLVIQSYAITLARFWDYASAAIVDDVMAAKRMIAVNGHYDTGDLVCLISPRDEQSVVSYLIGKGAQFPSIATDSVRNGSIGKIAGVDFIVSESVSSSYALVCKPKTCATYKELVSLRSTTVEDPYRSLKIRVVEEGTVEITDPKAIVLIKGTQSATA